MNLSEIAILVWTGIVVVVWLTIRRLRPDLVGRGDDFNKQIIDGVKLANCPHCQDGQLAPYFESIKKRKAIIIPPGFNYIIGPPDEYR